MRLAVCCVLILLSQVVFAQGKKELQDEVNRLKAEIELLKKPKTVDITIPNVKVSYGMGVLLASNIKSQGADSLDIDAMAAGIRDVLTSQEVKVPQNEAMGLVQNYMQQAMAKKSARAKEVGRKFLEENKTKAGVITTASGLQYEVLKSGSGKQPTISDRVTVHYTGSTLDGNVFDSSVRRGQPYNTSLTQVIKGWTEALQLMKEGDKWMLYIPSELGYGERGSGAQIPPHSTLLFEVELIKVN